MFIFSKWNSFAQRGWILPIFVFVVLLTGAIGCTPKPTETAATKPQIVQPRSPNVVASPLATKPGTGIPADAKMPESVRANIEFRMKSTAH